jgi:hypothetical protein
MEIDMKIPYWTLAVAPLLSWGVGFGMNAVAVAANGGTMPVQFPFTVADVLTNGFLVDHGDIIHSVMTPQTHFKFLCDWILVRDLGIASPGDLLLWLSDCIATPFYSAVVALVANDYGLFRK